MVLRSKQFDDVYFSAENGLAETQHVFLNGNDLPGAWADQKDFVIVETGFGTGLNFFAVWDLFDRTALPNQRLHYISFEKYPLPFSQIRTALTQWDSPLSQYFTQLEPVYPLLTPGIHRIVLNPRLILSLIFDDVNSALPEYSASVDCWFLDGFKPSANPAMWSDTVFQEMARLSRSGTTFATFTAAGFVRRGLQKAGFDVQKVPGFGTKREMLIGKML